MSSWTERGAVSDARVSAVARGGRRRSASLLVLLVLPGLAVGVGCRQDMHDAPLYTPLEASTFFADGRSARPLVEGTVARGHLRDDTLLYTGRDGGEFAASFPFPITAADLDRGQQRYDVFCSPCHDRTGSGNGMIMQRGFKRKSPSFHDDRLRNAPAGYLYDVITNGFGAMLDYSAQIPVEDRWRIVAYVRALQLSRHATPDDLPADQRSALSASAAPVGQDDSHGEGH